MQVSTFAILMMAFVPASALVGKSNNHPPRSNVGSKDVYFTPPEEKRETQRVGPNSKGIRPPAPVVKKTPIQTAAENVAVLERVKTEEPEPVKPVTRPAAPVNMVGTSRKQTVTKNAVAEAKPVAKEEPVAEAKSVTEETKSAIKEKGLPPKNTDNAGLDHIFAQNQAWKASKLVEDPDFFNKLGNTHTPEFMWIGCVDARVPPDVVMQVEAGKMFVQRNVANMVVNTDTNLLSALQYGVSYLKVKHIIVCGHYECGGVKAAEAANDFEAPLELWLRNIRDVYAKHRQELDAIENADARHRRLVDLNVIQQCINVFKAGEVQKRRAQVYEESEQSDISPLVHAMVFDPKSGDLKRLDVNFDDYADELSNVYGLHVV